MTQHHTGNKRLMYEKASTLNDGQKYHIKMATDLGYNKTEISVKLNIFIGYVEAYQLVLIWESENKLDIADKT